MIPKVQTSPTMPPDCLLVVSSETAKEIETQDRQFDRMKDFIDGIPRFEFINKGV